MPERIETKHEEQKIGTTLIVLPFKSELSEELYNEIESALVNMDPDTVLFLKNIKICLAFSESVCYYK